MALSVNKLANYINERLGVKIYDESRIDILLLNNFSQKEIEKKLIDDLVFIYINRLYKTNRLSRLTNELSREFKKGGF